MVVKESIGRAILERGRPVRLPSSAAAKLRTLERTRAALRSQLGCEPSANDVADAVGIPLSTVVVLQRAVQPPLRLDVSTEEGGDALGELIADHRDNQTPQELLSELLPMLDRALGQLQDPRQCDILRRHYGLGRCDTETVRQIGAGLGLSGARVSQLESAALAKLASLPAVRACREALAA